MVTLAARSLSVATNFAVMGVQQKNVKADETPDPVSLLVCYMY